jgi:hypothetical protein
MLHILGGHHQLGLNIQPQESGPINATQSSVRTSQAHELCFSLHAGGTEYLRIGAVRHGLVLHLLVPPPLCFLRLRHLMCQGHLPENDCGGHEWSAPDWPRLGAATPVVQEGVGHDRHHCTKCNQIPNRGNSACDIMGSVQITQHCLYTTAPATKAQTCTHTQTPRPNSAHETRQQASSCAARSHSTKHLTRENQCSCSKKVIWFQVVLPNSGHSAKGGTSIFRLSCTRWMLRNKSSQGQL